MDDLNKLIKDYGDATSWLNAELYSLNVHDEITMRVYPHKPLFTGVSKDDRRLSLTVDSRNQKISMVFVDRGTYVGDLPLGTMKSAAVAAVQFLIHKSNTQQMCSTFPSYVPSEFALCHEQGAKAEVEFAWSFLIQLIRQHFPILLELAAYLRQTQPYSMMYPITELGCIAFSRCTGQPFTSDGPVVRAQSEGKAQILDLEGKVLFDGTIQDVIANLERYTPTDWACASQGDMDTYTRYLNESR